jgi:hypothetical protein
MSEANICIYSDYHSDCSFLHYKTDDLGLPRWELDSFLEDLNEIGFSICRLNCVFKLNDIAERFEPIVEPENHAAWITMASTLKRAFKKYRTGVSSVLESEVGNIAPVHFGYRMNVALKDILTVKIYQFHESGIFSVEKIRNITEKRSQQEEIGPQVLTLEHLTAGFVVICVLLSLSILVFFAECSAVLLQNIMKMFIMGYSVIKFTIMNKIL